MSAISHHALPRDARRTMGEPPRSGGPPRIELSALSSSELRVLLVNLRQSGRHGMAAAVQAELDARSGGVRGPGDVPPLSVRWQPRASVRRMIAGGAVGGLIAVGLFSATGLLPRDEPRPELRAPPPLTVSPATEARGPSPLTRPGAEPSRLIPAPPGREAAAESLRIHAQAPQVAAEAAERTAVDAEATTVRRLELALAEPSLAVGPAFDRDRVAPPAAEPHGQPLIVSQGLEANLLGSATPRTNPLGGLQSSNPARMATAITAAR